MLAIQWRDTVHLSVPDMGLDRFIALDVAYTWLLDNGLELFTAGKPQAGEHAKQTD